MTLIIKEAHESYHAKLDLNEENASEEEEEVRKERVPGEEKKNILQFFRETIKSKTFINKKLARSYVKESESGFGWDQVQTLVNKRIARIRRKENERKMNVNEPAAVTKSRRTSKRQTADPAKRKKETWTTWVGSPAPEGMRARKCMGLSGSFWECDLCGFWNYHKRGMSKHLETAHGSGGARGEGTIRVGKDFQASIPPFDEKNRPV